MIFAKFCGPSTQSRLAFQAVLFPVSSFDRRIVSKACRHTASSSPRSFHSAARAAALLNLESLTSFTLGSDACCEANSFQLPSRNPLRSNAVSRPHASGVDSIRESFRESGAPGSPRLAPGSPRPEPRSPRRGAPRSPRPKRSGSSSMYSRAPRSFAGLGTSATCGNLSTGIT